MSHGIVPPPAGSEYVRDGYDSWYVTEADGDDDRLTILRQDGVETDCHVEEVARCNHCLALYIDRFHENEDPYVENCCNGCIRRNF